MSEHGSGTARASGRVASQLRELSAWHRFLDRFVPAEERTDALWILGVATVLSCIRALVYQPMQMQITGMFYSPRVDELGFALRATAVTDVVWGVFAAVFVALVLRFTKAPKATALYIILAGLLLTIVSLGDRLALNAVTSLSGSEYQRSLWSDLQPMMLAAMEAVGVALGAWASQLMSGEQRPADGSTFLPAVGWTGTPLTGAAWLAVAYATVRAVGALATTAVMFVPEAYTIFTGTRQLPAGSIVVWPYQFAQAATVAIYGLVAYFGVKRGLAPVTIWLAFLLGSLPGIVSALGFLPSQVALMAHGGGATFWAVALGALSLVAWPLSALPPLLGVWLATRPERVSDASATLRAQDNDHW
ncbi:MAG: hypothetical protein P4L93_06060 [Coriobacteriia bacterium]|nr:hypothetical protein [Coriobacteriia bacterium]